MIDFPPTILEFFGCAIPKDMLGKSLQQVIASDEPVREAALFGIHGGHVNCTDGRFVYMRGPAAEHNSPLNNYTLMPTHMNQFFSIDELGEITLAEPFTFTKGVKTMRIHSDGKVGNLNKLQFDMDDFKTKLYNIYQDPEQRIPLDDSEIEEQMINHMVRIMKENDAPLEQYERLGL